MDQAPLSATPSGPLDTDRDGLPDSQEVMLGTSPLMADTDHDGYGDGEEFAMQTSPTDYDDKPRQLSLSIGMSARGEGSRIKLFTVILDPDGTLANNSIRFGALVGGKIIPMELDRFTHMESGRSVGQKGGPLFLMEFDLPRTAFRVFNEITYFAVVGEPGTSSYASADKVDLFAKNGIIVIRHILTLPSQAVDPTAHQTPGTTIHQPIPPGGDNGIPLDWEPGQVCYQETQVVGASGATVVHEVISAECVSGWDTYCASDCAGTVGSSYQTLDTGVLLGG